MEDLKNLLEECSVFDPAQLPPPLEWVMRAEDGAPRDLRDLVL